MSPRPPTLEEVAIAAGVSRGTAGRALSDGKNVSVHALAAVKQAATTLGYRPNLAARSLVLRRSGSVALVVSEDWDRVFVDPYFAGILRGINDELGELGSQLLLAIVRDDGERNRFVRFAAGVHMDGAFLVSFGFADPFAAALEAAGVPAVAAGRGRHVTYSVDVDNRGGAARAVAYLAGRGRTRIGTIAGPRELTAGKDRLTGWRTALVRAGLEHSARLIEVGDFGADSGQSAAVRLLERVPDLDGLFAASDLMALGAIEALRAAGRRVPEDVSVVGFDDVPAAASTVPGLTTVAQPIEETGRAMVRLLFERLAGTTPGKAHVVLPTRFVERGSA